MTLSDLAKADSAAILKEIGVPIEVFLDGVLVRTATGQFIESVETISPGNINQIAYRPAFVLPSADYAGITLKHTVRIAGEPYRLYGEPKRFAMLGMVQQLLVK